MDGIVQKSTGSNYIIKVGDKNYMCKIKGKFRIKNLKTTNPIAVGDKVAIKLENNDDVGVITKIYPRKNYIIRKSINLSREAHIIAANVDHALLLITLINPVTPLEFIDRFLASSEAYSIPTVLVFNKIDLYDDQKNAEMQKLINLYSGIGYKCLQISAAEKTNIELITQLLNNKVSVIVGNSGVGKSTLINKIDPTLSLKTAEISDYHKTGKHTTTFAEMFDLQTGGSIIDTPGIKGFGLIDMENENISHYFPEIFAKLTECKYDNCTHINEPRCAVRDAVETGEIAWTRFKSYLSIVIGNDKYRTPDY